MIMQSTRTDHAPRARRSTVATLALLFGLGGLLAGCAADPATAPPAAQATRSDTPHDATAVPAWDVAAQEAVKRTRPSPPQAFRQFAYLSLAQYAAVVAAEDARRGPPAFLQGAVAGASAAALAHLFPSEAATFASLLEQHAPTPPGQRKHFASGVAMGRTAAEPVLARARNDRYGAAWDPSTRLTGPGTWTGATPLLPTFGAVEPFFLETGSALRPPPPPAFGSAEFLAAIAEVKQIAALAAITPEHSKLAFDWQLPAGTVLPAGYWNQTALALVAEHGLGERQAARILTLMHGAMFDAVIAAHHTKYTYWFVRPSQADPTVPTLFPPPSHPSYPSNHSAASGAASAVLAHFFPEARARLEQAAADAGMSRLYAGIHYRFDVEVGQQLGRGAADAALTFEGGQGLEALLR
jgi:membrane-associated phospholipid phosphatase